MKISDRKRFVSSFFVKAFHSIVMIEKYSICGVMILFCFVCRLFHNMREQLFIDWEGYRELRAQVGFCIPAR